MGTANSRSTFARLMRHAPAGARAYCLFGIEGKIPRQGGWSLDPFEPPTEAPPGLYNVFYLSHVSSEKSLPGKDPRQLYPSLQLDASSPHSTSVLPTQAHHQMVAAPPVAAPATRVAATAHQMVGSGSTAQWIGEPDDPVRSDPQHIQNRVESLGRTMKGELAKDGMILRELGEVFAYSQAYREELATVARSRGQAAIDNAEMATKYTDMMIAQMERLNATFTAYTTPAKPIDYVTAFTAFLKEASPLLREVVGALRPSRDESKLPTKQRATDAAGALTNAKPADSESSTRDVVEIAQSLPSKSDRRVRGGSKRAEKPTSRVEHADSVRKSKPRPKRSR